MKSEKSRTVLVSKDDERHQWRVARPGGQASGPDRIGVNEWREGSTERKKSGVPSKLRVNKSPHSKKSPATKARKGEEAALARGGHGVPCPYKGNRRSRMASKGGREVDAKVVWMQLEDRVVPRLRLSVTERVVYAHLLRHSRLEGKLRKGEKPAEDFVRWLYRERRLTASELTGRLRALDALACGKLRPRVGG